MSCGWREGKGGDGGVGKSLYESLCGVRGATQANGVDFPLPPPHSDGVIFPSMFSLSTVLCCDSWKVL